MSRLLIAVAIAAAVSLVAALLKRGNAAQVVSVRRNALPTRVPAIEVGLDAGPAIIVFTESSCNSCQTAVRLVRGPAGAGIPVADIEYGVELTMQFYDGKMLVKPSQKLYKNKIKSKRREQDEGGDQGSLL